MASNRRISIIRAITNDIRSRTGASADHDDRAYFMATIFYGVGLEVPQDLRTSQFESFRPRLEEVAAAPLPTTGTLAGLVSDRRIQVRDLSTAHLMETQLLAAATLVYFIYLSGGRPTGVVTEALATAGLEGTDRVHAERLARRFRGLHSIRGVWDITALIIKEWEPGYNSCFEKVGIFVRSVGLGDVRSVIRKIHTGETIPDRWRSFRDAIHAGPVCGRGSLQNLLPLIPHSSPGDFYKDYSGGHRWL